MAACVRRPGEQREPHHDGGLWTVDGRVVSAAAADMVEAARPVQAEGRTVGRSHLEKELGGTVTPRLVAQVFEQRHAMTRTLRTPLDADVQQMRFVEYQHHHRVTSRATADLHHPAAIAGRQ